MEWNNRSNRVPAFQRRLDDQLGRGLFPFGGRRRIVGAGRWGSRRQGCRGIGGRIWRAGDSNLPHFQHANVVAYKDRDNGRGTDRVRTDCHRHAGDPAGFGIETERHVPGQSSNAGDDAQIGSGDDKVLEGKVAVAI